MKSSNRNLITAICFLILAIALTWGAWIFYYNTNRDNRPEKTDNGPATAMIDDIIYGQWNIVAFIDVNLTTDETEQLDSRHTANYYIRFNKSDNTFFCNTDCNSLSGDFLLSGNSISFTNIASTEMACDDMSVEETMKDLLPLVTHYIFKKGNIISLKDSFGRTVIKLVREPDYDR